LNLASLIRLNKPSGAFLLFLPCAYSILIFAQNADDFKHLLTFFVGSMLMRSAGCIINDIFDKNFDTLVARTAMRPIATRSVSVSTAATLLALLLILSFLLLIQLPITAIKIGTFSLIPVILYPLVKRFSYFPQVFLGFTFNIGALVVAASILHKLTDASILVYLGCIFWTMGYDTIYGFMDIADDKKIGIKSLSIKIEHYAPKFWLALFYTLFISCMCAACFIENKNYNCVLLIAPLASLIREVWFLDLTSPQSCLKHFNFSVILGLFICAIISIIRTL
jgi:4-hydroxybenzoate polyprenyltransferase